MYIPVRASGGDRREELDYAESVRHQRVCGQFD